MMKGKEVKTMDLTKATDSELKKELRRRGEGPEKEIWTLRELVAIGYPEKQLRAAAASEYAGQILLARENRSCTLRFRKKQLEKYWGWIFG